MRAVVSDEFLAGMGRAQSPSALQEAERALVASAARGERAAQQELLGMHLERMRRLVFRLVGPNSSDIDDLLQTACVEILRSLSRYRGEASFRSWAECITTRVVYRHFRSTRRRTQRIEIVENLDAAPSGTEQQVQLEWREAARRTREVLEELKPDQRVILSLVAFDGRSLGEAAAMLDISLSAAKSRYMRARHELERRVRARPDLDALLGRLLEQGEAEHG
jgi:RNA polymerase sigma-70 factor, ECF subfamily